MRAPDSAGGKLLNCAPAVWIGRLSYSLYLWQQLFMFNTLTLPWYIKILGAFACAAGSYYLVERPCLQWRSRLMRKQPESERSTLQLRL